MQAGTTIWDIVTKLQIVEGSIRANPVAPVVTALGHEVSAAVPPGPRLGATTLLLNLEYAAAETCFLAAVRRRQDFVSSLQAITFRFELRLR